jgi:type I restriction enzyme S subunit
MSEHPLEALGSVCEINPDTLTEAADPARRYRYIDLSSIKEQKADLSIAPSPFMDLPSRARRKVAFNDVLLGTVRPNLKNFAIIESEDEDLLCSTGFAVLRSKANASDPRFIFHAINSEIVARQLNALVTGSNYPAVNATQVGELLIPVPPLPEQKKIAEILSGIDMAIENQQLAIDKLSATHRIACQKKISDLSRNSEMATIGSISNKIIDYRGKSPPKHETGVPLITAKNIRKGFIDMNPAEYIQEDLYEEWTAKGIPSPGDILVTTEAPLGNVAIAPSSKFAIGQRVICISPNRAMITPEYLLACMKTDNFQGQLTASSTGSTVSGVRQGVLLDCNIPLPGIEWQRRIGNFDLNASKLIYALTAKKAKLAILKQSLASDLLSGRKRVSI